MKEKKIELNERANVIIVDKQRNNVLYSILNPELKAEYGSRYAIK